MMAVELIEVGVGDPACCAICGWEFKIGAWADLAPPHPVGTIACCPGVGRKARVVGRRKRTDVRLPNVKPKHRMMGGC